MLRFVSTLLVLLTSARALWAEPLDPRQVPAAAAWFVHLDADAARSSLIGQRLRDLWLSRPQSARMLEQARETFGIDPARDIRSITVYGTSYTPDSGVVIARGKVDQPRLTAFLGKLPGYRVEPSAGHTIYYWTETDPNRRHQSAGAFFGDDTVVIAPDGPAVLSALAVLEGKSPGLSRHSPLSSDIIAAGAILQAAAAGLAEAKGLTIQSPVVRQCQSGSFTIGESAGQMILRGRVVTDSSDTAAKICKFIEGARAMAELQTPDNPELSNLLHPLKVTSDDKTVEVQWQYSSLQVVKIIQAELARATAGEKK
ncbi:MAG TPA: hypothetical protein VFE47_09410 [Tepidisphaeraceae bacterium]|jgi:hypothetical protein|nr:hypothetical protein [Tepidisphaeraceae bacterium]